MRCGQRLEAGWSRGPRGECGRGNQRWPGTRPTWSQEELLRTEVVNLGPGPTRCELSPDFSACQALLLGALHLASCRPQVLPSPFEFPIQTSYSKPNFPSDHDFFQYSLIPKISFQDDFQGPARDSSLGPPSFQMEKWAPLASGLLCLSPKDPPLQPPGTAKSLLFQIGTCPCCFSCPFLSPTCSQGLLN